MPLIAKPTNYYLKYIETNDKFHLGRQGYRQLIEKSFLSRLILKRQT